MRPCSPPDAVYIESWGPEYHGAAAIAPLVPGVELPGPGAPVGDPGSFFHKGDQTVVEWQFENRMADGRREAFDGVSLVRFSPDGRIARLQEFGCNSTRYDPYRNGPEPEFSGEAPRWF